MRVNPCSQDGAFSNPSTWPGENDTYGLPGGDSAQRAASAPMAAQKSGGGASGERKCWARRPCATYLTIFRGRRSQPLYFATLRTARLGTGRLRETDFLQGHLVIIIFYFVFLKKAGNIDFWKIVSKNPDQFYYFIKNNDCWMITEIDSDVLEFRVSVPPRRTLRTTK